MNKIYLIRHGETQWNNLGIMQGSKDIPLNEIGKSQSFRTSCFFKDKMVDNIYCSNSTRAIETASMIGKTINVPIEKSSDFNEMKFGLWEGLKIEDIKIEREKEFLIWDKNPQNFKVQNSECLKDVQIRALSKLNYLMGNSNNKKNIIIVSHGTTIKTIILGLLDIELSCYNKFIIDNASISLFYKKNDKNILKYMNNTSHLDRGV